MIVYVKDSETLTTPYPIQCCIGEKNPFNDEITFLLFQYKYLHTWFKLLTQQTKNILLYRLTTKYEVVTFLSLLNLYHL